MSNKITQQKNHKFSDIYTPNYAINPLLPFINKKDVVWDCAFGEGHLAKALIEKGFKVVGKKELRFESEDLDCNIIITNPPYGKKELFLERAFELKKPFAFLMPLTTLEGIKRGKLFAKNGIELIIPNRRINFIMPNKQGGAWFPTAWFCWKLDLPKELNFVELKGGVKK
jgi:hypothetical protein